MSDNIPQYIKIHDLDQVELSDILSGGKINENIDPTGNHIIDTTKDDIENSLMKISQSKTEFSKDKIDQFYSTQFTEFTDNLENENNDLIIEDDIKQTSDDNLSEKAVLETQIDELSKILEMESQRNIAIEEASEQNYNAMKSVIIEQRIKNNEGTTEHDFSDSFPFLPKDNKDDVDYDPIPYASGGEDNLRLPPGTYEKDFH